MIFKCCSATATPDVMVALDLIGLLLCCDCGLRLSPINSIPQTLNTHAETNTQVTQQSDLKDPSAAWIAHHKIGSGATERTLTQERRPQRKLKYRHMVVQGPATIEC
jgi:hypothetical protein